MAGEDQDPEVSGPTVAAAAAGVAPEEWRDWAGGLPAEVLEKVAGKVVAQAEAAFLKTLRYLSEAAIQEETAMREDGNCLFIFARLCKPWRKAQLKVGGPLRTRVDLDVVAPGSVALAKWALAEGCPREDEFGNMAHEAARYGHLELVKWLCGEKGFAIDGWVMMEAAWSGNLELVQFLRGEGCPRTYNTCRRAVDGGHVEVLRWARENGCQWGTATRDRAAAELG